MSGNVGGNVKIGSEIRDDRPRRKFSKAIPNTLRRLREKIRRNVDRRVHPRRLKRVDEDFGLDPRSGPVFEQHDIFAAESRHLSGAAPQNRRLGPRQVIFVEAGDFFEQLRAALVVQPAAGERSFAVARDQRARRLETLRAG